MKYIRTKDKIIDLTSKQVSSYKIIDDKTAIDEYGVDSGFIMVYYYNRDVGEHIEYDNKGGHSMDNWYLKDIIKQADSIPELCDRFVVYIEDLDFYQIFDYYDEAFSYICASEYKCKLLGVLETDKGLIYKAKLNDEGELELI